MSSQQVLVTGASGFIGLHLVRRLVRDGHRVRCLIRASSPTSRLREETLCEEPLDLVYGELEKPETLSDAVAGVDTVYHLAGLTRAFSASHFTVINAGGTDNLLQACAAQPTPPRFVLVSSLAAAGPARRRGMPLTERDLPQPISPYGRSKYEAEKVATRWADSVPISIVRPPYVVGEADAINAQLFRHIARWGFHPSPGLYNRDYSFVHATDLVEIIVRVAERGERLLPTSLPAKDFTNTSDLGIGIYYGSTTILSFHEFGRRIGAALGRARTPVLRVLMVVVCGMGIVNEIKKRLTGRLQDALDWNKVREAMSGPWICSDEKVKTQLDFSPTCSFDERLRQTADWYRNNGEL